MNTIISAVLPDRSKSFTAALQPSSLARSNTRPSGNASLMTEGPDRTSMHKCDVLDESSNGEHPEEKRRAEASANRKTPLSCGNVRGSNVKRKPKRKPGKKYATDSYGQAIQRACDKAFPHPELSKLRATSLSDQQKVELRQWQSEHGWSPNQLRHVAATEIRRKFGLEAARIILLTPALIMRHLGLPICSEQPSKTKNSPFWRINVALTVLESIGHRNAAITKVYAELDQQKAIEAMLKIG